MRSTNFFIDELEWQKFILRVGRGNAGKQIRGFIEAYNLKFQGINKEDIEAELKVRSDFEKVEEKYNELKTTLSIYEAKNMAENIQRESDQAEFDKRMAKMKLNTIKEDFKMHFTKTPANR